MTMRDARRDSDMTERKTVNSIPTLRRVLAVAATLLLVVAFIPAAAASHRPTSRMLRLQRYDKGNDGAIAIATSPDSSTVYVSGRSARHQMEYDYLTIAYDAGTGVQRWSSRWDDPTHRDDEALSVTTSPDGSRVFVTGDSGEVGTYDAVTIAYRA